MIGHLNPYFNLLRLHNNSFDNQEKEINKNLPTTLSSYIYIYIYIYIYDIYIYNIYIYIQCLIKLQTKIQITQQHKESKLNRE